MPESFLPDDLQDKLAGEFLAVVRLVAEDNKISIEKIDISYRELDLALEECCKDMDIMVKRRFASEKAEDFDGLSIGKLAGALLFRLCRYKIIHIQENDIKLMTNKLVARKLQEISAIRFVSAVILKIKTVKQYPELLYVVSRRHTNQEMLGLMFDMVSKFCEKLKSQTSLDIPPFDQIYRRG